MKRKSLLFALLLALFMPWAANAQTTVTIGEGTATSNTNPIGTYYNYSITEQLYTAEEIGTAGTISSISFYYMGIAAKDLPITVYMANVDAENLSTGISLAEADEVFSGTLSVTTTAGWVTINLDTPFDYDGSSNLLIGFIKDYLYYFSGQSWQGTATTTTMARYTQNDYNAYTTSTVPANAQTNRPNIQMEITPAQQSDCETPTALTALDEPTDTEFSFAIEGGSGVYNIEVKEGSADWASYQQSYTDRTVEMSDLASNTSYRVRVQSVCDVEASGWAYLNFITKNPCAAPTNLQITDLTPESATLSWTAGYRETEWTVKYKMSSETEYREETVSGTPTLTLRNLASCTVYNVQVYNCRGENDPYLSSNFTTAAGIPLNQAFNASSIPTGWAMYTGLLSNVMSGTALTSATYGWTFGTGNNVFDSHARVNIYGNYQRWLVMPAVVMEDNVQLTFDLALTVFTSTSSASPTPGNQADDRFIVLIQTESGWEILREWNNSGSEYVYDEITNAATGQAVAIDLSNYANQTIAIAFYGESTESGGDNNLHIDNVSIDYIPSCAKPTGLAKSDVTAHEATISWTSDAAAWQVQLNDEEPIDVEETTYTFENLTPETAYTAKVRANCGGTYSEWTNAVSFTTAIACPVPTSFATSNVGAHSVTLNWTSDASEWVVAYKTSTDEEFREITVTEKPYVLGDLDPETSYTVKVKAVCGGIDGESQYTSTRSFTTTVACPAPGNLTVSNLTVNGATLSWTELGDGRTWYICLNDDEENLFETSETTYTFDRLESETVYTAKVKSDCSAEGVWSSTVSFEPTAKLVIGSGSATSSYLPSNTNYDYSFTQQIYTAAELGEAGVFESIDFYMTSTSDYTRNLDIYMVSTDKNAFESNTDWIAVTDADLVFSGEVAFTAQSWTTITLDNAFIYDGTQNVAIVVDDNSATWSSRSFRSYTASAQQAIYKYQDNDDIPITFSGSGTLTTSKNQIRILKSEMSDCMKPTHLTATEVGPDFATLSWTENAESTEWVVVYNNESVTANTNENFELTGLDFDTDYIIYVYPTCGESPMSDPITIHTLAGCPAPQNLTMNDVLYTTATLTWNGYNDSYDVYLGQNGEPNILLSVDFADGIPTEWDNTSSYPWVVVDGYIQSGNAGQSSSTSAISVIVTYPTNGTIAFDAECRGEGTSSFWDHCDFYIDTERVFYHGEDLTEDGWNNYSFDVTAGEHTFKWSYTKDSSVDKPGDYFAIDNIVMAGSTLVWNDPIHVTDAEYNFEGLTVGTNYYVKVQGFCGDTPSEESEVTPFETLPYVTVTLDIDGVGEDNWIGTNNSGYYLIASPMMNTITPSANNGFITDDFDLYYFDEGMEDFEWRNYHVESFDIVPGKGYIYASKTDTQLQFTGVPNTNGEVTLTLQKTDGNAFEGWNLVGNPFNQTAYLPAGHTFYTMDYDQNLIVEVSQGDERNIEAMQAVFVVAEEDGETITFSTTAPEAKSAMVALNLNNRNGLIDRAIIRFDEGSTMPKLQLKRNSTKLYIPQDGNDYAVVRSEGMGAMPVNFKAESNGSYTITLSTEEVSFAYLHLIDKVANTDVDLLANPSYSFDALTTDFANRFELVFATSNSSDEDNFAFFNNGSFVINNSGDATLQVIDVNGRVLTSESINGCANVNVNAAAGVYMIRLVNGDNVKVQKVVVR